MNHQFWREKKVLITGHTGFKGSWLSLWLQRLGADVVGYSLAPPTSPSLFEAASVAHGMTSIHGDVRDLGELRDTVLKHRPEIVFHMAAQSLVRASCLDPVETYSVNVMGTVNMLEAVRQAQGVRAVVNVTSDKCYENREWPWGYRENDPMGGADPYSSSKGCAELVTAAYRRSYFHNGGTVVATARAGNVIGGGDWACDRLIPDMVRAFAEGQPVVIRSPGAVRPWQHVLEPLCGYLCLAERLWSRDDKYADGWNFGPADDDMMPVSWVVEQMAGLWGEGACWEVDAASHPHEAHSLKLDSSRSKALLGWNPRLRLAEALEWTARWYENYEVEGKDMRGFTEKQIERYEEMGRG